MKILIGICGIGNGHLSRQTNVINLLMNKSYTRYNTKNSIIKNTKLKTYVGTYTPVISLKGKIKVIIGVIPK